MCPAVQIWGKRNREQRAGLDTGLMDGPEKAKAPNSNKAFGLGVQMDSWKRLFSASLWVRCPGAGIRAVF